MTRCKSLLAAATIALVPLGGFIWSARSEATPSDGNAETPPVFDMQPTCRDTAGFALDLEDKPTVESCLNEEQTAQQTLEKEWSSYGAGDREACIRSAQIGGPPSYVNLLWCLRDAKEARQLEQKPSAM